MEQRYKPHDIAGYLAQGFLKNPLTALLGIFLLFIGYLALVIMPREEDPQIAISGGTVIVAMPGASASEVEKIIVDPLERKLREIKGIEHIYGMAMDNVGMVNVMYYIGENREDSNLKLYDKVMQNLDLLPKGAMQPLVKPFDIDIDIPIVSVAFFVKDSNKTDDIAFYNTIKNIQQEINSVENVSKTTLQGAKKPQYNIEVDLPKLSAYNISLGQVMQGVSSMSVGVPEVKTPTQDGKIVVFGIENGIKDTDDIANIAIANYGGSLVYIRDIAKVTKGIDTQNFQEAKIRYRDSDDEPIKAEKRQTTLSVSKLAGTNAVVVAQDVLETIAKNEQMLHDAGIGYIVSRNYGIRANNAVNELMHHLVITIIFIAVMLVFALGWRESLIVTFTVPAILAITLFIAYLSDQTINRITLFAFLLSLGLLVDAAIIVIENIHRHTHSHNAHNQSMEELLVEATDEIGPPTNIATLAIILTMVPMAFVGGMMGSFMKPIPLNVPVALIASLVVAYIFTPYLALKLLSKGKEKGEKK